MSLQEYGSFVVRSLRQEGILFFKPDEKEPGKGTWVQKPDEAAHYESITQAVEAIEGFEMLDHVVSVDAKPASFKTANGKCYDVIDETSKPVRTLSIHPY